MEVPIVTNEFLGVAMRKDMRLHILHGWIDYFFNHEERIVPLTDKKVFGNKASLEKYLIRLL